MAHESVERVMAETAKSASKAGGAGRMAQGMTGPMMGEGMGPMMGPMMGGMMGEGMGPMMGGMMGEGMGPMMAGMMGEGMGPMMAGMMGEGMMGSMMGGLPMAASSTGAGMMMRGAAAGAAVSATGQTGKSLVKRFFGHPVVLIGLGIAAGYLVHKYRKEIIAATLGATPSSEQ